MCYFCCNSVAPQDCILSPSCLGFQFAKALAPTLMVSTVRCPLSTWTNSQLAPELPNICSSLLGVFIWTYLSDVQLKMPKTAVIYHLPSKANSLIVPTLVNGPTIYLMSQSESSSVSLIRYRILLIHTNAPIFLTCTPVLATSPWCPKPSACS